MAKKEFADTAIMDFLAKKIPYQHTCVMSGKRTRLEVSYHAGVGGGGTDEILRPTLMCVSNGGCYRLVVDSFGKRENQEVKEEGPQHHVHRARGGVDRNPPLQGVTCLLSIYHNC